MSGKSGSSARRGTYNDRSSSSAASADSQASEVSSLRAIANALNRKVTASFSSQQEDEPLKGPWSQRDFTRRNQDSAQHAGSRAHDITSTKAQGAPPHPPAPSIPKPHVDVSTQDIRKPNDSDQKDKDKDKDKDKGASASHTSRSTRAGDPAFVHRSQHASASQGSAPGMAYRHADDYTNILSPHDSASHSRTPQNPSLSNATGRATQPARSDSVHEGRNTLASGPNAFAGLIDPGNELQDDIVTLESPISPTDIIPIHEVPVKHGLSTPGSRPSAFAGLIDLDEGATNDETDSMSELGSGIIAIHEITPKNGSRSSTSTSAAFAGLIDLDSEKTTGHGKSSDLGSGMIGLHDVTDVPGKRNLASGPNAFAGLIDPGHVDVDATPDSPLGSGIIAIHEVRVPPAPTLSAHTRPGLAERISHLRLSSPDQDGGPLSGHNNGFETADSEGRGQSSHRHWMSLDHLRGDMSDVAENSSTAATNASTPQPLDDDGLLSFPDVDLAPRDPSRFGPSPANGEMTSALADKDQVDMLLKVADPSATRNERIDSLVTENV